MATRFTEVDPNLVWQTTETKGLKTFSGRDLIKPWSDLRKLPEFSYKTSYQVGLPYEYELNYQFEPPAKAESTQKEESFRYDLFRSQYSTTTGSSYTTKYVKTEPGEKPTFSNFLSGFNEQIKAQQFLLPVITTENASNYQWHGYDHCRAGEYKDHSTAMLCKSPKIAKEMQPSFEINEGGVRTEKDIYLSQTHYAQHYFSPVKVRDIKASHVGVAPRIRVYENPNPIDPELRLPFRQVNLRKKTLVVPHRGMITETQEHYRPQVDFFALNDTVKEVEKVPFTNLSKESLIKELDKYHTDYSHIGHNWNTQNM